MNERPRQFATSSLVGGGSAFTLIELLVVIAIIALIEVQPAGDHPNATFLSLSDDGHCRNGEN